MKAWELLDSAAIPGGGTMNLYRTSTGFSIRVGHDELMNSHAHGSEDALAALASARLGARPGRQVLVGGLGMGYTAAAALRDLGADGGLTIAELVPAVVAWNRGHLAAVAGDVLGDPRVDVHQGDVAGLLRGAKDRYDLILLDVDNGPHGLTSPANGWLYGSAGLKHIRAALRRGGVLGVWSVAPDDGFTRRLQQAGFAATVERPFIHGTRGPRHVVWIATAAERMPA
jgi:spermidine synthase